MNTARHGRAYQRGAALITALILLIVITTLTISSMRSSILELRMAGNEESRISAFQMAQAMSDAITASPTTTPVLGGPGFTICTPAEPDCNLNNLLIPGGVYAAEITAGDLTARVVRLSPATRPPPRGIGSSADKFSAAAFQVQTTFDRTEEGLGRSDVAEGLLVLISQQ